MPGGRALVVSLVLCTLIVAAPTTARNASVRDLLDRYAAGQFQAVLSELAGPTDFNDILKQLERDGPSWIGATGDDRRPQRELAAATFALEAARIDEEREWKLTQKQPQMCAESIGVDRSPGCFQPLNVLYWEAPPRLIEWGCSLLRRHQTPLPVERWWQLAALAVAQRSEDPQFLVGDPKIGLGVDAGEIGNRRDEIKHLDHVSDRFPTESRFLLGQGIARDRVWPDDAAKAYAALERDPDVGGEAVMRFGAMQLRQRRYADALTKLDHAETLTRDPYVVFLARYFRGRAFDEQKDPKKAEAAYRGAAATVPHAQSATLALAALVARDGRRAEAQQLVRDMLAATPPPLDPWRRYVHADDRFWPQLIGRLRAEILK